MNGKNNKLPRLRFPEFRDAGEWEEKRLGEVASFSKGKGISKADIIVDGKNKCIRYGELYTVYNDNEIIKNVVSLTNTEIGRSVLSEKNDILMPTSDVTPNGLATASALDETGIILGGDILIIRTPRILNSFFCYFVSSHKNKIMRLVSGVTVYHIYGADMATLRLNFPILPEQQKIADCLSSLDDLITAQTQKLAHLKTHKKGLMQQLFPTEGETQPKLRFPEFRDAGDWQEKRLGDIGNVSMCKRVLKHETSVSGDIPFYKIGTFGKHADAYIPKELYERYRDQYSFPQKGEILISASGTIGRIVVYDGSPAYFQDSNIVWISNNEKIATNAFLLFCYGNTKWKTSDNTIARLYNDNLRSIEIPVPSLPEQQKIADCLSSLDDLITAQGQKLAHLKTHKKGLMQQLFPAADEVNG